MRADTLPLVFRALGAESLPRGARVRVRITGIDLLTLDVHASVVARLDDAGHAPPSAPTTRPKSREDAGRPARAGDRRAGRRRRRRTDERRGSTGARRHPMTGSGMLQAVLHPADARWPSRWPCTRRC